MDSSFDSSARPAQPPSPTPQPVVQDIFAQEGVQNVGNPVSQLGAEYGQSMSSSLNSPHAQSETMYEFAPSYQRSARKRLLLIVGGLIILIAAIAAAWVVFSRDTGSGTVVNQNVLPTNTSKPIQRVVLPTTNTSRQTPVVDTDGDGLADAEESTLKTDIRLIDTDQDGLTDREEVRVYTTDPLEQDTDSDGYFDGEEVKRLYNPKGPGKLFNIKEEIHKAETNTNS